MFGNYSTMAHRHINADVGFFDVRGTEEAFLKAKPPLSDEIIQSYKPQSPWPSSPTFEGDFVLLCEFSELEGPKPVITIPSDSGGDFDQNDFALKIMAIDYNATNVVRSGGTFSLVDDTGVVLEDPKESAFAYVHHFTLYDVIARGYVRPFCIAYITSDQRKIIRNLEWLTTQFGKVSESFRFGNRCQFKRDLEYRLADIRYTIDNLHNEHLRSNGTTIQVLSLSEQDEKTNQKLSQKLAALEKGLQEVEDILNLLAPEMSNPKLEAKFQRLEQLASAKKHRKPRTHRNSSNVHEEGYHSDGKEQLSVESDTRTIRRISTCESLDDLQPSLETLMSRTPQIIRMDGYRKFDIRLRTLHELCGWGYKAGLNRVRKMHKHLSRNPLILHMEKKESKLVEPASALLTIGRTVTMNFMQNINLHCGAYGGSCQERYCRPALMRLTSTVSTSSASPSLDENSLSRQPSLSYEARFVPGTTYASMESLYYDVNESLDSSSDSDEILEIPKKLRNGVFVQSDDGSWLDLDFSSKEFDYSSSTETSSSTQLKGKPLKTSDTPSDEVDGASSDREGTSQDIISDFISTSTSSSRGDQMQDTPVPASSADTSYIVRRHQKVSVGSYASRINSFSIYLPGSGVRSIIGHYSFAIHLVYALLSGRTVIVVSSPRFEKEVTALIRTLWLFVPGHSSTHHLVVPWYTQPLCLMDLCRMKLIGLSRHKSSSPIIPAAVQRYSTVFDYETSTLLTPPYKGIYLSHLVKSCKYFRSDQAYIAFIYSQFLELAQKAFVYYHSYCLNSPVTGSENVDKERTPSTDPAKMTHHQIQQATHGYLSKLGITDCDVDIVQYWVEIIKQQQIDEMYVQAGSAVIPPPSMHLDHRQCKKYQV